MLLAIDIGNSRIKLGLFGAASGCVAAAQSAPLPIASPALPEPQDTLAVTPPLAPGSPAEQLLADWLAEGGSVDRVVLASVNRPSREQAEACLDRLVTAPRRLLAAGDLPLEVRLPAPERVGIDRLAGAVAANRLRRPGSPAVVVDLGTAITIDLITPDGAFDGGAILPGIAMASRALHEKTDLLPEHGLTQLEGAPDAVGKDTTEALHAGLFWGAVGAVREIIARQADRLTTPPQVFLTGGAAPSVARLLGGPDRTVRYLPDLVLQGIAVAADASAAGPNSPAE